MEYRKIQKTGGATYIVSLPKDWIMHNHLKEGNLLRISRSADDKLIISSKEEESKKEDEVQINVNDQEDNEHFIRKLIALYLSGFTILRIYSSGVIPKDIQNAIKKFSTMVIGLEIIEEGKDYVVMQDLSNPTDLPIDKLISRIYLMAVGMVTDASQILNHFNKNIAEDVIKRDEQVDRLYWFISKQFYMAMKHPEYRTNMNVNMIHSSNIRTIAKSLERISDHAENIAKIAINTKLKPLSNEDKTHISSIFEQSIEIFKKSYESFVKHDTALANEVIDIANIFFVENERFVTDIENISDRNFGTIVLLVESIVRIAMYSADIAETTINDNV